MAHEKRRAPIDEALRNAVVQRIRQAILDAAGTFLPLRRRLDPFAAMRDVGPGPDMGDTRHQRVDIAIEPVELRHLAADPGGWQALAWPRELHETMRQKPRMAVAHHLAEIGDLTDF